MTIQISLSGKSRGNIAIVFLFAAVLVALVVTFHDRIPLLKDIKPVEAGEENVSRWEALGTEMRLAHDQGEKIPAYRFSRKRLQFALENFGKEDDRYLEAVHDAGFLALDAKNFSHAKTYLNASLERLTEKFGGNHPKVANELGLLGMAYARMYTDQPLSSSEQSAAEEYFEECLRIFREHAPDHEYYNNYKEIAAYFYRMTGHPQRAAELHPAPSA